MKNDGFLHISLGIELFFAFSALNDLPSVSIAPKTKPHVQKTYTYNGQRETEFVLRFGRDRASLFRSAPHRGGGLAQWLT
jgi:hypothetical protein